MTDIIAFFAEQLWGIITGIIVSLTVYIIVTFIPIKETARYKATFYRRKISKIISNPPIHTKYVVKSNNLEEKQLMLNDVVSDIKLKLCQNGLTLKGERGSATTFSYIFGKSEIEITLTPSYHADDREELIVDYFECNFEPTNTRYNDFDGHFVDIIQAFRKVEHILRDAIGDWRGESLTCEIKRLYKFVGVLKDLNMSSLQGKIGGEYEVEMFENYLVVYGEIETRMSEMLKDIITYYY